MAKGSPTTLGEVIKGLPPAARESAMGAVKAVPSFVEQVSTGLRLRVQDILNQVGVMSTKEAGAAAGVFRAKEGTVAVREDIVHDHDQLLATLVHELLHEWGILMEGVAEHLTSWLTGTPPVKALQDQVEASRRIWSVLGKTKFMEAIQSAIKSGQSLLGTFVLALRKEGVHEKTAERMVLEANDYHHKKAA